MPSMDKIAPDLAPYVTEEQATSIVKASAVGPAPKPKITDLKDLDDTKRRLLILWLKWFRAKRIPLRIPEVEAAMSNAGGDGRATRRFLRMSPTEVARKTNLDPDFLQSLISQVAAIRAEVNRGKDAWLPVAVTPRIQDVKMDEPNPGDCTIVGNDFDSYETRVTRVRLARPDVGEVVLDQQHIEDAKGSVTSTQIIVPASLIPGGGLRVGDQVTVRADGLDSAVYTVPETL